jgi:hypothetical protein
MACPTVFRIVLIPSLLAVFTGCSAIQAGDEVACLLATQFVVPTGGVPHGISGECSAGSTFVAGGGEVHCEPQVRRRVAA